MVLEVCGQEVWLPASAVTVPMFIARGDAVCDALDPKLR
jgi:hypothetical protein